KDFLSLRPGDIVALNTPVEKNEIIVNVEEIPWFSGIMGTKKKKYAVKINKTL
ncbi:MAG TPA: flagellar motor switch protein FliM, partial [Ruminococcaceae bacterium]|nr:flagellar motor switch protein FliM [Oscillospiraceae bacterium]